MSSVLESSDQPRAILCRSTSKERTDTNIVDKYDTQVAYIGWGLVVLVRYAQDPAASDVESS